MRNTRKRRHLPLQLESFEPRQLLSASVAQSALPLVADSAPAIVASDQTNTGTTIEAATNQSFAGYLGTFNNLSIVNAPTGAFTLGYSSHVPNPLAPDTTDRTTEFYDVTINWGDGTSTRDAYVIPNANGGYDLYGTHVFSAAGAYQIAVSLQTQFIPNPQYTGSDPASGLVTSFDTFTSTAQVSDNNPNAPQLPQLSAPNGTFTGSLASFFGDNTTNILWGDGGSSGYDVASSVDPSKIPASRSYPSIGTYTIAVLQRNSNTIYFAQMNVTGTIPTPPPEPPLIAPTPPDLTPPGTSTDAAQTTTPITVASTQSTLAVIPKTAANTQLQLTAGKIFSGTLTTFTPPNGVAVTITPRITIQWGDGTTSNGTALGKKNGTWTIQGNHAYKNTGHYTVTISWGYTQLPKNTGPGISIFVGTATPEQAQLLAIVSTPPKPAPASNRGHR